MWPAVLLGAALASSFAAAALVWAEPGTRDDAFVVLAQARSLIEGNGFALGPDSPPVAACTSLLDLLQKAALLATNPVDPVRAAGWLGMAWLVLAAALGGAIGTALAARVGGKLRWVVAIAAAWAVGGTGSLSESAAYGLEGPLFAVPWLLLLLLAVAAQRALRAEVHARLAWAAVPLAVLLTAARPEGLVLGIAAWLLVERAGPGPRRIGLVRRGAVLALVLALYHAAYAAVFGAPFPNSYYAKRAGSFALEWRDGGAYVVEFFSTRGVALPLALAVLLGARQRSETGRSAATPLLWLALVAVAVVVVSGGDAYLGARLMLPAELALLLGLLALLGDGDGPRGRHRYVTAGCFLMLGHGLPTLSTPLVEPLATARALASGPAGETELFGGDRILLERIAAGLQDAPNLDPASNAIAHRHAQRFLWYRPEGLALLDLTGLTDPEIARRPTEGPVRFGRDALDVALERRVAVLFLDHLPSRPASWAGRDLGRLFAEPARAREFMGEPVPEGEVARRLAEGYCAMSFREAPQRHVNLLVRRDLVPRFEAQGLR